MKRIIYLFLVCGLLTKLSYADIPNCHGYFPCDASQGCTFTLGNYGGKCLELFPITKGQRYVCNIDDGGLGVYIDALDSSNAQQQNLILDRLSATQLKIDAVNMNQPSGTARLAVVHGFGTGNVQVKCISE